MSDSEESNDDIRETRERTLAEVMAMESLCAQISDTIEAYSIRPSDVAQWPFYFAVAFFCQCFV